MTADLMSIGDLAEATGVSATTLRAWESRYGFPTATRLPSGHRRYHRREVESVRTVARRRDSGLRLSVAIAEMTEVARPASGSVFATLRREHPHLPVERLHKSTLTALSWAIEDEFCAQADRARIFGAFQTEALFRPSRRRWEELGRIATSAIVLADFHGRSPASREGARPGDLTYVDLDHGSPLRREWAVVCDSRDLPVALSAWEIPAQAEVPDARRVFEMVWTVDPQAVRTAARICAGVVHEADPATGSLLLYGLADDPGPASGESVSLGRMFTRMLSYVDRRHDEELRASRTGAGS